MVIRQSKMQRKWHAVRVEEMRDSCGTEWTCRMGQENLTAQAIPVQPCTGPEGSRTLRLPVFKANI